MLAALASGFRANVVDCGAVGFAVEPSGERESRGYFFCFFDKAKEDGLGDVARGFIVCGDAAGDRVDEGKVPGDEGVERSACGVAQMLLD